MGVAAVDFGAVVADARDEQSTIVRRDASERAVDVGAHWRRDVSGISPCRRRSSFGVRMTTREHARHKLYAQARAGDANERP